MARLIATSPFEGLDLPLEGGGATLRAAGPGPVWSIAPFRGREAAVARDLGGVALPEPGRSVAWGEGRLLWSGPGRALLVGADPPAGLSAHAALVAQGDGIACAVLEGPGARAVLARLVPLDLREGVFGVGATARTLLVHMPVQITRIASAAWEIMAMRSMAGTLVEEVRRAMRHVGARTRA
ncbi:sarcosine oxidase subunit gamma [Rubellimicrobium sp. CFH 75288]|uniref:sarcosine oxidase subunit gamma n=1 Tax=Rubellimicrobium sp. CFH 75288 TaxID=2697034 RepID=UPI00352B5C93